MPHEYLPGSMAERLQDLLSGDGELRLLRVKSAAESAEWSLSGDGDLNDDWSPKTVFEAFLSEHGIAGEEAEALTAAYLEAVQAVREEADEAVQPEV